MKHDNNNIQTDSNPIFSAEEQNRAEDLTDGLTGFTDTSDDRTLKTLSVIFLSICLSGSVPSTKENKITPFLNKVVFLTSVSKKNRPWQK